MEYAGEGVKTLTVPERATITNMGAELGATTSIFPSDEITRSFLKAQGREEDWVQLSSDPDAVYDEVIAIDLSAAESRWPPARTARTTSSTVDEIGAIKVDQVCIGSCTNSSYLDLMTCRFHPEGQDRPSGCQPCHRPGFQAGATICWRKTALWPT